MRFHDMQKVRIINGFYATYKGFIKDVKTTKENKTEYLVELIPKNKNTGEKKEWIPEEYMKPSLF